MACDVLAHTLSVTLTKGAVYIMLVTKGIQLADCFCIAELLAKSSPSPRTCQGATDLLEKASTALGDK